MGSTLSRVSIQGLVTAVVALTLLVHPGLPETPLYVSLSGIAMAGILLASNKVSAYLRIFISVYGLGYVLLAVAGLLGAMGALPSSITSLLPPDFAATGSVAFAFIILLISHSKAIQTVTLIADPYFTNRDAPERNISLFRLLGATEGVIGQRLVGLSLLITFAQVAIQLRASFLARDLFNGLQEYNIAAFWYQLTWVFIPLAALAVFTSMLDTVIDESLHLRWRTWLTRSLYERWLDSGTHYRLPFEAAHADNPDQRIQNDVNLFIVQTTSLSIKLLSQATTLISFIVILWNISRDFVFPFTDIVVPGFLVWLAIGYAVIGTWLTHVIGHPLIKLSFLQEQAEADFRFSLARTRIFSEQIALLKGERQEKLRLDDLFGHIIRNYIQIIIRKTKLSVFVKLFQQISSVFPFVLAAPAFFSKQITLGQFTQTAEAFGSVQSSLSFFVESYTAIASYRANADRLHSFGCAMTKVEAHLASGVGSVDVVENLAGVEAANFTLMLPDGRKIVDGGDFALSKDRATLIVGSSGSGKSTLFRAIAGIWPFSNGRIRVPAGQSVLLLPQKPYIPLGTLRNALTYPRCVQRFPEKVVREALEDAELSHLADKLDVADCWDNRLSGGEQQRLSIVRALLIKPDWLFLDESTAALDEACEARIYGILHEKLTNTTIVSIGHRSTLNQFHDRFLELSSMSLRQVSRNHRDRTLTPSAGMRGLGFGIAGRLLR
ncbi:ABC transporter ATP-binding protein/permease [Methylobacterium sp. C33D]